MSNIGRKYRLAETSKSRPSMLVQAISREHLINKLKRLDYEVDEEGNGVLIFRNCNFPFQRISLPNDEKISVELVKKYAHDLEIPIGYFLAK